MNSLLKKPLDNLIFEIAARVPASRRFLRKLGLRTKHTWLSSRPIPVSLANGEILKLCRINENFLTFNLFWKGSQHYEPITTLVLIELLEPGSIFVDVGANIGFFSLVMANLKKGLSILAFEPNPKNYRILRENVQINKFKEIECSDKAISDRSGNAQLFLSNSDMSASLSPDFDSNHSAPIPVKTISLDEALAPYGAGKFTIKVDVEGHEASFFGGAVHTISVFRPDIVTEVAMVYDQCPFDHLRPLGYYFYQITSTGLHPVEKVVPIIYGHLFFPNYLLSTKKPKEMNEVFLKIQPAIAAINLFETSKCFGPDIVPKLRYEKCPPDPLQSEPRPNGLTLS